MVWLGNTFLDTIPRDLKNRVQDGVLERGCSNPPAALILFGLSYWFLETLVSVQRHPC
jgi:hypothetical protein